MFYCSLPTQKSSLPLVLPNLISRQRPQRHLIRLAWIWKAAQSRFRINFSRMCTQRCQGDGEEGDRG